MHGTKIFLSVWYHSGVLTLPGLINTRTDTQNYHLILLHVHMHVIKR